MTRKSLHLAGITLFALALSALGASADAPKKPRHKAKHKDPAAATAEPSAPADSLDVPPSDAASPTPAATPQPSAASSAGAEPEKGSSLPEGHVPQLTLKVEPANGAKVGELVHVSITAEAPVGDDVTIAEQSFSPFEVYKKQARVEPPSGDKQRFQFDLELLALESGDGPVPAVTLRVVTKDNSVGTTKTEPYPYKVQSLIANEPNAQPKQETKPVVVLEDNYLPIYVLGALVAAALVAGLTLLVSRYLQRRRAKAVPPPPPRPPWEIAVEALAQLRSKKQSMLDSGQGAVFVDQLSDVVRAYLGGRFAFEGLETTTDEMIAQLKARGATLGFTQEVGQFLGRCDLVKFAKVEPDADEVDLLFAKAQDLVQLSEPDRLKQSAPNDPAHVGALQPTPPRRSQRPSDGGGPVS